MTEVIKEKARKKLQTPEEAEQDKNVLLVPEELLKNKNAALEFVKAVCKVLSLDSSVSEEVTHVRRNMLRLLRLGEFDEVAEWNDPCISFVLPEVICKACNHCRDIDLCKDNYRSMQNDTPVWHCPLCQTYYDNTELEYMMLDTVNRKAMAYTLQDLQCKKCLQIKMDNMSAYCTCFGEYQTLVSKQDLIMHLKTFKTIASHFKMDLLLESVEWMLQMNPTAGER